MFLFVGCVKKEIPTTGAIHGTVRESVTAQPLAGCSVMLMPTGMTTVTGSDGSFHFENILPDTYSVEVSCHGYYSNKKSIIVGINETSMSVDILLTKYDPNNRLAELGVVKVSDVKHNSARVECEIIEQGSSSVTERGFLYSETSDVTIATSDKVIVKTTEDIFSTTLKNLVQETDYYVVAYAVNGRGTAYSEMMKFTTGNTSSETAPSNVIYVSVSGNDNNDGATWSKAKRTIKSAVALSEKGKQIWVSAGTFSEMVTPKDGVPIYGGFQGNEITRETRTQKTTIKSLQCEAYGNQTVINGFNISELIHLYNNAILENSTIENNTTGTVILGKATMSNCFFRGNSGKILNVGALVMYNCLVANCTSIQFAGNKADLYNCTIANNSEGISGGSNANMYNCLVWNTPLSDGILQHSSLVVKTADNRDIKFKNPSSGIGHTATDWRTADWSIQTGSSCINAGNTIFFPINDIPTDIAGNPRVNGGSIDIGAYEY